MKSCVIIIRKVVIIIFIPLYLVVIPVSYKLGMHMEFRYFYETIFIGWVLVYAMFKFRLSQNLLLIQAVVFFTLAIIFDAIKKDSPAIYMSNMAFVLLFAAVLVILIRTYFKLCDRQVGKRVLFVANAIVGEDPGVSGGESRFIELGKGWQRNGYEIHLLGAGSGKTLCSKMGLDVRLHCLTKSNRDSRLEFLIRSIQLFFYLPILAWEFNGGIVYSTSEQFYDILPGVFLKVLYHDRIRFASAVHWLPPVLFWNRQSSKWYNSLFFLISERIGLILGYIFADVLFPVSESTYVDMKKAGLCNERTFVVKCGVNMEDIESVSKKYPLKKQEAVFMKRIQSVKGIFDLIDIWGLVLQKKPEAKLKVIGSGIDENQAKEIVKERGLGSSIEFTGVIYDIDSKFKIISESDLFLLPSYEENWAIVIGEALAAGVPVICYDLKELREVWENSVTFVPVGNKDQFADKVLRLLNDERAYEEIKNIGHEYIKRYSWRKIAEEELNYILSYSK